MRSYLIRYFVCFSVPEGDECALNACGPNSGCRFVNGNPICFCLPEFEGQPPQIPCHIPENPCNPSVCGPNTQCSILSNGYAKCTCLSGYVESPNTIRGCIEPRDPCDPSPCGQGAICDSSRNPVCYCPESFIGNPFRGCTRPIVTPELCAPGPCGRNADCYVVNNQEQCFCRSGYAGDPYSGCQEPPRTACDPNPCGPRADCVVLPNGQTACQCPDGYGGDPSSPTGCHGYECTIDDECSDDQACLGFRCRDPCPGSCGYAAHCRVLKHHPICSCPNNLVGNPLLECHLEDVPQLNPCSPSPCAANTECVAQRRDAVCRCLPGYLGNPEIGCRPECVINSDCATNQACIDHKCKNPCDDELCGINAICKVFDHTAICECKSGYVGNALYQCMRMPESVNMTRPPCQAHPCGEQYGCLDYGNHVAICDPCNSQDAQFNPRCRPECIVNADCSFNRACIGHSCIDPCPGSCGHDAECFVQDHVPHCQCRPGYYGNPFEYCSPPSVIVHEPISCGDDICGTNTECRNNGHALACVCLPEFYGDPLIGCRPQCIVNSECAMNQACHGYKCINPCKDACGVGALCSVINHFPVCYCPEGYAGDALVSCNVHREPPYVPENPCDPSPCGPNSRCLVSPDGNAICSCLPSFRGSPPSCQRECISSSECPLNKACLNFKCADPCPGTCGLNARCEVRAHNPICACPPGFVGDPFQSCIINAYEDEPPQERHPDNPCVPSPCGPNSICQVKQGRPVCSCQANFIGGPPYCRPECINHQECNHDQACINEKCQNPCINACGANAECHVVAHSALCSCLPKYQGDAFVGCTRVPDDPIIPQDPCYPSPCGQNTKCINHNGQAKCSCIPPYLGDPYTTGCRPECVLNSDCPSHQGCLNQHCRDPCPGACGSNAECTVANHIPICACAQGYIGDAFTGCRLRPLEPEPRRDPCSPSPCGPHSICRVTGDRPVCSCQTGMIGAPPQCRPECVSSSECPLNQACVNRKCIDPCPNTCGINARCQVLNHNPICSCPEQYPRGDPFDRCIEKRKYSKIFSD